MALRQVEITERALFQRIDRALKKNGHKLCTTRNWEMQSNLGHYHLIDLQTNTLLVSDVDLESLGRLLEVLAPWEKLRN